MSVRPYVWNNSRNYELILMKFYIWEFDDEFLFTFAFREDTFSAFDLVYETENFFWHELYVQCLQNDELFNW